MPLPKQVRELSADLATAAVFVGLVDLFVFAQYLRETPLCMPLGSAFVLLVPGYTLIAALIPEEGASPSADNDFH